MSNERISNQQEVGGQAASAQISDRHRLRRGTAAAAGGALVIGSGVAVGVIAAQMAGDWHTQKVASAQQKADANPTLVGEVPVKHPRSVTEVIEEHVDGEPKVVYLPAPALGNSGSSGSKSGAGSSGSASGGSGSSSSRSNSSGSSSSGSSGSSSSGSSRSTVTPQKAAPAPASGSSGSAGKSTGS